MAKEIEKQGLEESPAAGVKAIDATIVKYNEDLALFVSEYPQGEMILDLDNPVKGLLDILLSPASVSPTADKTALTVSESAISWLTSRWHAVEQIDETVEGESCQYLAKIRQFPSSLDGLKVGETVVNTSTMNQSEVWDLLALHLSRNLRKAKSADYLLQMAAIGSHDGALAWARANGVGIAVRHVKPLITELVSGRMAVETFDAALVEMTGKREPEAGEISKRVRQIKPRKTTAKAPKELPMVPALPSSAIAEDTTTPVDAKTAEKNAKTDQTANLKWLDTQTPGIVKAWEFLSGNLTQFQIVRSKVPAVRLVVKDQRYVERLTQVIGDIRTACVAYADMTEAQEQEQATAATAATAAGKARQVELKAKWDGLQAERDTAMKENARLLAEMEILNKRIEDNVAMGQTVTKPGQTVTGQKPANAARR